LAVEVAPLKCNKNASTQMLLETLDSDRGPWVLDLSAKMEALDPSRADVLRSHVAFMPL